jgi:REP element-mobilizing transposase RayT
VASNRRQIEFEFRTWGGVRSNAGRLPRGRTAGVCHLRRPAHSPAHPLHITLRLGRGIPSLREHSLFSVVRRALARGKRHFGFSLVQFSVQRDHLHLIAEANDRRALSRGMQGLSIRVARAVNAQLGRSGKLFADRYHARVLTTPRTVRLALRYVLLNVNKHFRGPSGPAEAPVRSRKSSPRSPSAPAHLPASGFVDACSSAPWFADFERPLALAFGARAAQSEWERESDEPPVAAPRSWLLRTGWKRAGPFDVDDVPGGSS